MSNIGIYVLKVKDLKKLTDETLGLENNFLILSSGSYNEILSQKTSFQNFLDYIKTIENRSYTGSFTGSLKGISLGNFSGSFVGSLFSKNTIASGSFSGSLQGPLISKNVSATGSFYGDRMYGSLIGNNLNMSGSFSGSLKGKLVAQESTIFGNFSGSNSLRNPPIVSSTLVSKNISATGSFSGSVKGKFYSKDVSAIGDWSGTFVNLDRTSRFTSARITGLNNTFLGGKIKTEDFYSVGNMLASGSMRGVNYKTDKNIYTNDYENISYYGTSSNSVSCSFSIITKQSKKIDWVNNVKTIYQTTTVNPGNGNYTQTFTVKMPDADYDQGAIWIDYKVMIIWKMETDDDPGGTWTNLGYYEGNRPVLNYTGVGNFGEPYNGHVDDDTNWIKARWEAPVPNITLNGISYGFRKQQTFSFKWERKSLGGRNMVSAAAPFCFSARYMIPPTGITQSELLIPY